MGDFNPLWHRTLEENQCGTNLADQINESNYGVLNEDFSTRITLTVSSSPDIKIASPSLLLCTEWETQPALSSDHILILISIKRNVVRVNAAKRTYVIFSIANWASFREYLEEVIVNEKHFRKKCYQKSDQIFSPKQLSLPMNVIHYVPLIQTIHISRQYRQISRIWWETTYEQNREHTWENVNLVVMRTTNGSQ